MSEASRPLAFEVHPDAGAVARRAVTFIATQARAAIAERGRFVVAFSGGGTPATMLYQLAAESIDWSKVHIVQVDERIAPSGSPHRNLTQLRTELLERVPIPTGQIHAMPVLSADLESAAREYGQQLATIAGMPPVLDLVHLGLGGDGHTASLMPGDTALDISHADVAISAIHHGWRRMTLTYPIINRARAILWLVTGEEKSAMVSQLLHGDGTIPAGGVTRTSALLLLDTAAASEIEH